LSKSVVVPVIYAVGLVLGSALLLWGLPDWAVRWASSISAYWFPLAATVAAIALVYLHQATVGWVMRWIMIPVAVVASLGLASERLISIGKSLSKTVEVVKLVEVPVQTAATPLPCVPTPAVKVLNPAKTVKKATVKKRLTVRKPAAESTFWSF
jgi:hypothetical protein